MTEKNSWHKTKTRINHADVAQTALAVAANNPIIPLNR